MPDQKINSLNKRETIVNIVKLDTLINIKPDSLK